MLLLQKRTALQSKIQTVKTSGQPDIQSSCLGGPYAGWTFISPLTLSWTAQLWQSRDPCSPFAAAAPACRRGLCHWRFAAGSKAVLLSRYTVQPTPNPPGASSESQVQISSLHGHPPGETSGLTRGNWGSWPVACPVGKLPCVCLSWHHTHTMQLCTPALKAGGGYSHGHKDSGSQQLLVKACCAVPPFLAVPSLCLLRWRCTLRGVWGHLLAVCRRL